MAKTTESKKNLKTDTNASNALKDTNEPVYSSKNPSKFAPTKDAIMNEQALDAEDGLLKLFEDSVKDLYWAENALVKALPKMAKAASVSSLKEAILTHLEQTITHVNRLEEVFGLMGKKPQAKKCDAMEGLMKEGEGVIESTDAGHTCP